MLSVTPTAQQDRLKNPHTWTYEVPLAVVLTLVLVAVLGVHTGRAGGVLGDRVGD